MPKFLPGDHVPHVDVPVRAAGGHHGAVRRPGAVQQVLLEVVAVPLEHLDTPLTRAERTDVLKKII